MFDFYQELGASGVKDLQVRKWLIRPIVNQRRYGTGRNYKHRVYHLDEMDGYIRIEHPMRNR